MAGEKVPRENYDMKGWTHSEKADTYACYCLYLSDQTKATYDSMVQYLGEVRKWVEIGGGEGRTELRAKQVAVLKELKRLRRKKPKRKKALTAKILREWRKRLEKEGATKTEWGAWITMAMCFFGLLRVSEVIGRSGKREGLR